MPDITVRKKPTDWKRIASILLGVAFFTLIYFSPPWGDAIDPKQEAFPLTHEGKAALALFALTATWWVLEVIPIGVTAIAVGVIQTLFLIRPAKTAFGDYMDPSVCFILGSIVFGLVFTKTGLAKRLAYKMLVVVGERTVMIYLGCFLMTTCLTFIMAHTAVAATMFPLLMAIYSLYSEDSAPTRFGKGLFIGMAFTAGAGSIITLLGSARAVVALGFFKDMVGREISFFELTAYMFPLGMAMVIIIWAFVAIMFRPERKTIPGLRERARNLYERLGRMSGPEIGALAIVLVAVAVMSLQSFVPALANLNKSAVILLAMVLFFIFKILDLNDLEAIPWNIVLLFGGAMSIGFCLWETGAAKWLAVKWLVLFQSAPKLVFILAIAFFVMVMTNFIMNVAAIAISLPVAIVLAQYLNVAPEVILFASLATAGMPFILLIGAAPNAIAYGSGQFKSTEFLMAGVPASLMLMIVLAIFVQFIWPLMGMPVFLR
ncbi:MAG: SLC13 family permease [Candidatus Sumerlaeia bacterium]|nr:SLC13 family permease [Candidatus Sumerlaeia bacterium]